MISNSIYSEKWIASEHIVKNRQDREMAPVQLYLILQLSDNITYHDH